MNKISQWLLVIGLLFTYTATTAQEQQPNMSEIVTALPMEVLCGAPDAILKPIIDAGEVLVATNITNFRGPGGQDLKAIGQIWINPNTKSFSYVFAFPRTKNMCYALGGGEFSPYIDSDQQT